MFVYWRNWRDLLHRPELIRKFRGLKGCTHCTIQYTHNRRDAHTIYTQQAGCTHSRICQGVSIELSLILLNLDVIYSWTVVITGSNKSLELWTLPIGVIDLCYQCYSICYVNYYDWLTCSRINHYLEKLVCVPLWRYVVSEILNF